MVSGTQSTQEQRLQYDHPIKMKRTIIPTTLDNFLRPLACVIARDLLTGQINGSDKS